MRPVKPSTETETRTFIEIETQIERKKVANIYIYKWIADWNVNMSLFYVIFSRSPGLSVSLSVPEPSLNCHTVEVMIVPVLINHSWKSNHKKTGLENRVARERKKMKQKHEINLLLLVYVFRPWSGITDMFFFSHAPCNSLFVLPVYRYILMFNRTINHKHFAFFMCFFFQRSFARFHSFAISVVGVVFFIAFEYVLSSFGIWISDENQTNQWNRPENANNLLQNGWQTRLPIKNLIAFETLSEEWKRARNGD